LWNQIIINGGVEKEMKRFNKDNKTYLRGYVISIDNPIMPLFLAYFNLNIMNKIFDANINYEKRAEINVDDDFNEANLEVRGVV
jgi:hypothetical protein